MVSSLERFWRAHLHVDEVSRCSRQHWRPRLPRTCVCALARWRPSPAWQLRRRGRGGRGPPREALELYRALGAEREISFALTELAWMSLDTGELDLAEHQASEALERPRRPGRAGGVECAQCSGVPRHRARRAGACARPRSRVSRDPRRIGDRLLIADAALTAGTAALADGDLDDAEHAFRECLELARAVGDALHQGGALCGLGEAAVLRGEPEGARALLLEALGIFAQLGNEAIAAECLVALALTEDGERAHSYWVRRSPRASGRG